MAAVRDEVLGVVRALTPTVARIREISHADRRLAARHPGLPECHAPLRVDEDASELVCTSATCGLAYPVRDDIPVLLVEEAGARGAQA